MATSRRKDGNRGTHPRCHRHGLRAFLVAAPAAHASTTKYTFTDVLLPNGEQGIVYASTKTMKKKPDNVYCNYQTDEYENLGSYLEFLDPAPSDPDAVLDLCLAHFDERH